MQSAFVAAQPVGARAQAARRATCDLGDAPRTDVTMGARRNLKKEKALRNLEFSRVHRKRPVKFFNRRAANEALQNEDNEVLATLYGTIRFRPDKDEEKKGGDKRDK